MGTCGICGKDAALPFERYGQRVCSKECAYQRMLCARRTRLSQPLPLERTCRVCGHSFEVHSAFHMLCSQECRLTWRRSGHTHSRSR